MSDFVDAVLFYIPAVSQIVAGAAVIAAATPTPKDDEVLKKARAILDILAFNFGHAKNALKL